MQGQSGAAKQLLNHTQVLLLCTALCGKCWRGDCVLGAVQRGQHNRLQQGSSGPMDQCTGRVPGAPMGLDKDMIKCSCHTKTWAHSGTSIKIHKEKKKPIGTLKYVRNCLEASSSPSIESRGQHVTRPLHA